MTRRRAYSEPPITTSEQRTISALRRRIAFLEGRTKEGWADLTASDKIPELEDLREALVEMLLMADPRKGRNLDSSGRGGYDPLSSDGRSTVEGRQTLPDRDRLAYFRRQLKNLAWEMVEARVEARDPLHQRRVIPKRKCQNPKCPHRGRRQPTFYAFCGYCGGSMEEAA